MVRKEEDKKKRRHLKNLECGESSLHLLVFNTTGGMGRKAQLFYTKPQRRSATQLNKVSLMSFTSERD